MRLSLFRSFLLVSTLICLAATAFPQDTGSITGTVSDAAGAVIAGADVKVSNAARGITRTTKTNSDGIYFVPGLPGDEYDITITNPGFQTYRATKVVLRVGQKIRVDATLPVGAVASEIEVLGTNVAQVETQSSDLAGTVTTTQLEKLQLNGRNFTQLITLVPGVSNQSGQDEGVVGVDGNVQFSVNGGRTVYNNWEIDGGDAMDNGSNATLNVYPNLDAIAEVRVLTSNYGAQYGRNSSGTVEIETKSGTSKFHGSVFEYARNEAFNARNYFDDPAQPKPAYKKHDFGYTLGGPVYIPGFYNEKKDKTYFFWSQEWRREKTPQTFLQGVPSDAERAGDFSVFCPTYGTTFARDEYPNCPATQTLNGRYIGFPGNKVTVSPTGAALLPLISQATAGGGQDWVFQQSLSQPMRFREELFKIDHNINSNLRATFRFIHDSWETVTPTTLWNDFSFPTVQTKFLGPGTSMVARLNAIISSHKVNEFVASYTSDKLTTTNIGNVALPSGFSMGYLFNNGFDGKLPDISISQGGGAYGGGFSAGANFVPWNNSNPTYTFRDNFSWMIGKHNLQFGAYYVAAQKNEQSGAVNGTYTQGFLSFDSTSDVSTGNAFADMLMGNIASYSQMSKAVKYYFRYKILEPFLQDDWRITPRLTLNLGVRVSLFGTYRERYQQVFNFNPARYDSTKAIGIDPDTGALITGPDYAGAFNGMEQCGSGGTKPGCMDGKLFNIAPRIGFAWDPTGSGRTAIRAGYGIFYDHTNGNEGNAESLEGTPPLVLVPTQYNIVGYQNIGGEGLIFPLNPVSIPSKAVWPMVQQWHLDYQHEFWKNTVTTISYVGSKGTHLTLQRDINQLPVLPLDQNPFLPGQPLTQDNCDTMMVNGAAVTGQALTNLSVACGADPNFFRQYQGFGNISRLENTASSTYHALQVSARRNVGDLNFSLAYTWSHAIDNSSDRWDGNFVDSFNLRANRASSNFDQRHILTISYVYSLPFMRNRRGFVGQAFGNWALSGITTIQTGTPFSVLNGWGFGDNAGVANGLGNGSYADLVGDPHATPSGVIPCAEGVICGPTLFNPDAFAPPRGLTFGNSGRNLLNLPRRTNFDMALFKRFPFTEQVGLDFRVEAFNIFNHTQWSGVDASSPGSEFFLRPDGAHRARTLQLGMRFTF